MRFFFYLYICEKKYMSDFKEIQKIDKKLMYLDDIEVLQCYEHFKNRYEERLNKKISYKNYWESWICYLRGYCVGIHNNSHKRYGKHNNRMDRAFGNYLKDECLFKVIYVKVHLGIYVPLNNRYGS